MRIFLCINQIFCFQGLFHDPVTSALRFGPLRASAGFDLKVAMFRGIHSWLMVEQRWENPCNMYKIQRKTEKTISKKCKPWVLSIIYIYMYIYMRIWGLNGIDHSSTFGICE